MSGIVGRRGVFPLTALVGQERLKRALLLTAINPRLGGVLIQGEKGTAKSTAARALAALLPPLAVVPGCPFSCDPFRPEALCDGCAARLTSGEDLGCVPRAARVVDLPVGATEDRVVGTLDLEHAIGQGELRLEPGLLAAANRGVLYIDEVNLLGDHLVDVLLDAAAMGRNVVERDGISAAHPAEFVLIASMNPEEGELRPQLLDRFALAVEVGGMPDPTERAEVVRRRIRFEADPTAFAVEWAPREEVERERVRAARALLPRVCVDEGMLRLITSICAAAGVDGLRGDLVMYRAAATLAAYAGRTAVAVEDVREAAELALPHRRRRQPFDQGGPDPQGLDDAISEHQAREEDARSRSEAETRSQGGGDGDAARGDGSNGARPGSDDGVGDGAERPPEGGHDRETRRAVAPAEGSAAPPLPAPRRDGSVRQEAGRRSITRTAGTGRYVRAERPHGTGGDLAVDATLRAAAPHQVARRAARDGASGVVLRASDVRVKVRERRTGALILFVVDASGSMGAGQRMAAAKGAVLALLHDAYRRRDRVGLVAFRGRDAQLLLPPTRSVEHAERQLRDLPTGGRTPLAHGMALAAARIQRQIATDPTTIPLLVLLSDGRGNVALSGPDGDALADAEAVAVAIAGRGWASVVVDTEAGRTRLGLARRLSAALGARYMRLEEMTASGVRASAARGIQ